MNQLFLEQEMLKRFSKHSIIEGIILVIIGAIGIFVPTLMSLTVSLFFGWLLIFGGLTAGYHAFKSYKTKWLAWLKPFILIVTGILILIFPLMGVEGIGLLLAVYLFIDAFASFSFGFELRPLKGWVWMLFNGVTSAVLAAIFLIGWPLDTLWLVGLFVGISLFFDGFVLLALGIASRKKS